MNSENENKRRGPLQNRIIFFTLFCILLICATVSIVSFYLFGNYVKRENITTYGIGLLNLSESVDSEMNEVYRLVRYCQSSNNIANYIENMPESSSSQINRIYDNFDEEYKANAASKYIIRAAVIAEDHFIQICQASYSTSKRLPDIISKEAYYDTLLGSQDYDFSFGVQVDPFLNGAPKYMFPIIRPIIYKYNSDRIGYAFLEVSTSLVTDQMKKYHMDADESLLLSVGEHIYKMSGGQLVETEVECLSASHIRKSYSLKSGIEVLEVKDGNQRLTVLKAPIKMNGCYLIHILSPKAMQSENQVFGIVITFVMILVIGIGVVLTLYMDRWIYQPIHRIRKKIYETAAGDFSRDPSIEWSHELGEIGKGINDLSESVLDLMETRLSDEKEKRELEYQMLQSQINPHFLYNTLNSIKMMAQVQGATGISEMTTSLASLLRSISKGTSLLVPISEEISLVKDYFTIQNYRYGGMIEFSVNMAEPSIGDCKIVKFTLQPLVENAIFHGLEPKGGIGKIEINLFYKDEGTICIEVTDNGVGIPKEKQKEIFTGSVKSTTDFFKEIGISNVNKRLQYEFGEEYGITLETVEGQYTTMRVLLPGEVTNVQGVNS